MFFSIDSAEILDSNIFLLLSLTTTQINVVEE